MDELAQPAGPPPPLPAIVESRVDRRFASCAPAGWWPLIAEMHARLLGIDPDYRLAQVKQKWGLLRVYLDDRRYASGDRGPVDELQAVIGDFERRSSVVCERCGARGERCGDARHGGIRTLWIADSDVADPVDASTRAEATEILRERLGKAVRADQRVLVGFDFAYGYPRGFADSLGLGAVIARSRSGGVRSG